MFDILTEREFYNASLEACKLRPEVEDLEKVASVAKLPQSTVKLAKLFFEQLQLDRIPYENGQQRADDAMKLAQSYVQHIEQARSESVKIANGLLRVLAHAAEGYLAQNNIQLSSLEAVKIAGFQADSLLESQETEKTAGSYEDAKEQALEDAISDFEKVAGGEAQAAVGPAGSPMPSRVQPDTSATLQAANSKAAGMMDSAKGMAENVGSKVKNVFNKGVDFAKKNPKTTAGVAAGAGLGAGALYLLHRKKKDQAESQE